MATSEESLKCQEALVNTFAQENLLKLNVSKCEIMLFSKKWDTALLVHEVGGSIMPLVMLGNVWASGGKGISLHQNLKRTSRRHAVLSFTMVALGFFQGDISRLSFRAVLESCVMPVLLYGAENWILTDVLLERLEAFQGELAKRVLK